MADALLETQGLSRRFGALAAVDGVSLSIGRGQVHAVIGPNGAGKSTLINLLSGELRATAGRILFNQRDVTSASPDSLSLLGLGRSYQTPNIFPELSCAESVWLAAQSRASGAEAVLRAEKALQACGLLARKSMLARELSYGEQRQLEIAMVLATEPQLLLLDEPLAGLGHDEALSIVELLRAVAKGRTVILIEHDMDAVFSIAQAITVLVNGRVLETGTPGQIRGSSAVRDAYLGEELP